MSKCPRCFSVISDDSALFCENCGFSFRDNPSFVPVPSPDPSHHLHSKLSDHKLFAPLLAIFLIIVIIGALGATVFFFNSSRSLSIASIYTQESSVPPSNSFNNIPNVPSVVYSLIFNLVLSFTGFNSITSTGFGPCDFFAHSLNPHWKIASLEYSCPASATTLYTGTHKVSLTQEIVPTSNSYSNISYPIHLSFTVSSQSFAVTSKPYNFTINSTNFNSLKLTHAQLNNDTNSLTGATGYNISSEFYLVSDHDINITNACSPFSLQLVGAANWSLSTIHCLSLHPITFQPGRFKFNLTSQLIDSSGNLYNYSSSLPSSFSVYVILGQNILKSTSFTVKTS